VKNATAIAPLGAIFPIDPINILIFDMIRAIVEKADSPGANYSALNSLTTLNSRALGR
jgi:hypothetical protein